MPPGWKLKDVIVMLVGLALALLGVSLVIPAYTRVLAAGLGLVGLATIALGATSGFIDSSPTTSMASKLGMLAYAIGIPTLLYGVWHMI